MHVFFLTIEPTAFSIGPIDVYWYGLIIATAVLLGIAIATKEAVRQGVDKEDFLNLMLWVIPAAIIGARLYYVLFRLDYYVLYPWEIIATWKGGLAIHGGLIGALIVTYFFVKKKGYSFLLLADIAVPSLLLGQAIGRWGNFINQEAYGSMVSQSFLQGMHLPPWLIEQMNIHGVYYHPTFLYESLWNLLGFALLISLRYLPIRQGGIFFSYLTWYSIGRFFIEGLRTDSLTIYGPNELAHFLNFLWSPMSVFFTPGALEHGNIRIAQLICLVLIIVSAAFMIWAFQKKKKKPEEEPISS